MWSQMGVRQLRDNLTEALRRVRRGETIEVTSDGVPVAVLGPTPADRVGRLVAAGAKAPTALKRPLRRFPITGSLTASEALEEDRAER